MNSCLSGYAVVIAGMMAMAALSVEAGVHNVRRDTSADRVESPLRVAFKRIGTIRPHGAAEIAEKIAAGAFPDDESLIRPLMENICYLNAKEMVK